MIATTAQERAELAPSGTIRVGVNIANPATVTVAADGSLSGPCIDMARGLSEAFNLPIEIVRFASAGQMAAAEHASDAWDVAFLAIDPARAERLHFSTPYLTIEASYAVPIDSQIAAVEDVDRPGMRIATTNGAAYDLYLQRVLTSAERYVFPDPAASFAAFEAGGYDAVAGVRLSLERRFDGFGQARVLPGRFLAIQQAMVVPVKRRRAALLVDRFVLQIIGRFPAS